MCSAPSPDWVVQIEIFYACVAKGVSGIRERRCGVMGRATLSAPPGRDVNDVLNYASSRWSYAVARSTMRVSVWAAPPSRRILRTVASRSSAFWQATRT